eukprot:4961150-Pyramimonas_sp.AAC.2
MFGKAARLPGSFKRSESEFSTVKDRTDSSLQSRIIAAGSARRVRRASEHGARSDVPGYVGGTERVAPPEGG